MRLPRILFVALLIAALLMISLGPATASAASPCTTRYHLVCRGETLTRIAWMYGTSVAAIASANGIWNPNCIYAGQVLAIPCAPCWHCPPPPCSWCGGGVHVVRWGETLYSIARWYGSSVWAIANANGIANPNCIYAGQRLIIP